RVGIAALAFRAGELYAVQGEGPSALASRLLRVRPDGTVQAVVNLKDFLRTLDPLASIAPNPYPQVSSNPFALAHSAVTDVFYVVDSGANAVLGVTPAGHAGLVYQWTDNPVPTGLALGPDGALYVTLFSPYPYARGRGSVARLTPAGQVSPVVIGLTTPIGVAFDSQGRMFVLEFSGGADPAGPEGMTPGSGRLLQIEGATRRVVVDHLAFPTALTIGPRDEIYLTLGGGLSAPGTGSILRIEPCAQARR
ncbi:MAG: ScyD/ScyE family protein, partial [Actinobacteria bacterium]|nr:ScyD/ScyE family protein [Actinomycetota bacterium]